MRILLVEDLRHAMRTLRKAPTFAATAVLALRASFTAETQKTPRKRGENQTQNPRTASKQRAQRKQNPLAGRGSVWSCARWETGAS
jgi:hypothetical protein